MLKTVHILHGEEALQKAKQGIDLVTDTIKQTLGPKGRNVLLKELGPLPPRIVNDGKTIADKIQHDDPLVNAGVDMIKEICRKTDDLAGDGTTTTALIAQAVIEEGNKRLLSKDNPITLKKEIEDDLVNVIAKLKTISKPIETNKQVIDIATISANNDLEAGKTIGEIIEKVGRNAAIMVEKSNDSKIIAELHKGIFFHKGFAAPAFENRPDHKAILEDALILITDKKIQWGTDVEKFFENVIVAEKLDKIVIIADEIEGDGLVTLALTNKSILNGGDGVHILAINAPEFGPTRQEILEDIAIMTGATLISDTTGITLDNATSQVLGNCKKVISDSKTTTMLGGGGNQKEINKRIKTLKGQIKQTQVMEKTTREKLENRLMVLEAGVGILHAGGPTEIEAKERYLRLEDAILAVRSALKDGYVAGGGYTYYQLAKEAKSPILQEALKIVVKQIAKNAGKSSDTVIDMIESKNKGWNAKTDKYVDLVKDGVIDATLVVESAIKNAVSIGSYFLTMASMVVESADEKEKK